MRRFRHLYLIAITLATVWSLWAAVGEQRRRAAEQAARARAAALTAAATREEIAATAALARARVVMAAAKQLEPGASAVERDLERSLARARLTLLQVVSRPAGTRVVLVTAGG